MTEMVMQLNATDFEALANIRCTEGLLAAQAPQTGHVWLRGIPVKEAPTPVQQLPAVNTYLHDGHGKLYRAHRKVPEAILPSLNWQPLPALMPLQVPTALLPGQAGKHPMQLVRTDTTQPGAALVVEMPHLVAYANRAPAARLARLTYTLLSNQQALLLGSPQLALPGHEYWQQGQLLLPAGYSLAMANLTGLLQQQLAPTDKHWVAIHADNTWQSIAPELFVPCTRSSIRQTEKMLRHG